jgi:hypothetical protein
MKALPVEAQFSATYGIEIDDFNEDGNPDILLGGNFYKTKPEVGRYDASYGLLLAGDGKGDFEPVPAQESGIRIAGEVRDIISITTAKDKLILVSRNNESVLTFTTKRR